MIPANTLKISGDVAVIVLT